MDKQSLYTLMEDHGIRPTANRVLIASALLKGDGPKTMKELEMTLLSIDKSVISRTMALFRSHHLVHVIEGGTGVASYELCLSHDDDHDEDVHVHFFCEQCLRTICLNHVPTPSVAVPEGFLTVPNPIWSGASVPIVPERWASHDRMVPSKTPPPRFPS